MRFQVPPWREPSKRKQLLKQAIKWHTSRFLHSLGKLDQTTVNLNFKSGSGTRLLRTIARSITSFKRDFTMEIIVEGVPTRVKLLNNTICNNNHFLPQKIYNEILSTIFSFLIQSFSFFIQPFSFLKRNNN